MVARCVWPHHEQCFHDVLIAGFFGLRLNNGDQATFLIRHIPPSIRPFRLLLDHEFRSNAEPTQPLLWRRSSQGLAVVSEIVGPVHARLVFSVELQADAVCGPLLPASIKARHPTPKAEWNSKMARPL